MRDAMPRVNPEILRWARETAGLTIEQAAQKIRLASARGVSGSARLASLEAGEGSPSRALLVRMAKQYRRPLLTFYLSEPPSRGDRGQDFRTLPKDFALADEALLDALIRDVQARQSIVRSVLEEEDEAIPLAFIGSMRLSDGVPTILKSMRAVLKVNLAEFRSASTAEGAFELLRRAAERAGVYVLLKGYLGSHHTSISLEEFRGFALADPIAPFVVINSQEAKSARAFTLIHELAHLWLGHTGVSGEHGDLESEQFCNEVSGEFLLPLEELRTLHIADPENTVALCHEIAEFARQRNVSASMVAYRLFRDERIDKRSWQEVHAWFRERWLEGRKAEQQRSREREGGPDANVVLRHHLGSGLLNFVERMMNAGALTTSKAGIVLGVRAKRVQELLAGDGRDGVPHVA